MDSENSEICKYLGINTSDDELVPGYDESFFDHGRWYQFDFRGVGENSHMQEYAYSKDKDFAKTPAVISAMKSKGYDYYFCSIRKNGEWNSYILIDRMGNL
jgi:hypothetical protein